MTGVPSLQVLLDDDSGTFPYDLTNMGGTSYVLLANGYSIKRGREDEQGGVTAGEMSLTLNNSDGRFSPGSTIIASPSPIKVDQRIRIKETLPTVANTNLLSAENSSFEGGTVGTWVAAGTVLPTLSNSSAWSSVGTKSLLITWNGSGSNPQAQVQGSGFTAGLTYTVAADVFVPSGSPDVRIGAGGTTSGLTSVKDQTVRIFVTFVAASTTPTFFIRSSGVSGTCRVDAVMANLGSVPGEFNTATPTTYTRFTGYVKSWPVSWPATVSTFSEVQITATDAQARAERRVLRSISEEEIIIDGPAAYYPLSEAEGAITAGDASGNQAPVLTQAGSGAAVTFGTATGPTTDGLTAATFSGGKYLVCSGITYSSTPAIIVAFATTSSGTMGLWSVSDLGPSDPLTSSLTMSAGALAAGAGVAIGTGTYNDGLNHVVAVRWTAATTADVYIDGVLTNSGISAPAPRISPIIGANSTGANPYTGSLAHFAVFSTAPTGARLIAQSQAMLTGFAGESGTARITRIAGYAGIPVGTMDPSLTTVPFTPIDGRTAQDCIQEVADAEVGVVFVDGSGNQTFHNRDEVAAKTTPDLTLDKQYVGADVQPTQDDQRILNFLETTAAGTGSTQNVNNAASQTSHGRYPDSKTYLVQTDAEALDRANWLITNYAEPFTRYGTLKLNLYRMDPATVQSVIAAVDLDCWLRVTSMPSQTPGSTTVDVVVEGWTEEAGPSSWTLTCNVVARSLFNVGIYDDTTYGVFDSALARFGV